MAISLKNLRSSRSTLPPRVIIHAVEGVGKTSLAAEFPDAVYLSTPGEATPEGVELPSPGTVANWDEMVSFMGELAQEQHDFRTLIVDAMDGIEPLVWRETAMRNKWETVESPGFGKGYLAADIVWREFLEGCDFLRREKGMTIILITHSDRVNHEEPGHQPYKRYDLRLQKRAQAILCDWSDYIFFINSKVEIKEVEQGFNKKHSHAEGGGMRWIYTDARPAFVAKNRGATMPAQLPYKRGEGFKALAPHMYPQTTA
jgi:hypothetical protein